MQLKQRRNIAYCSSPSFDTVDETVKRGTERFGIAVTLRIYILEALGSIPGPDIAYPD